MKNINKKHRNFKNAPSFLLSLIEGTIIIAIGMALGWVLFSY